MFRSVLALVLFCFLLCGGLFALGFGARGLAAIGANGFIYPFWGLGLIALIPLSFVLAGRLALRIARDGKV
jgi:hypothetical protein